MGGDGECEKKFVRREGGGRLGSEVHDDDDSDDDDDDSEPVLFIAASFLRIDKRGLNEKEREKERREISITYLLHLELGRSSPMEEREM